MVEKHTSDIAFSEAPVRVSEWRRFRRVFFERKLVTFGLVVLFLMVIAAVFAPLLVPYDPYAPGKGESLLQPSTKHLLGTDLLGRDTLSRLIYGARTALMVGFISVGVGGIIGIPLGIMAGYFGGIVDETLMRIVDILLCLPVLPLLLGLMVIYGTSVWYLVILIAIFGWQGLSRIIRSRVLSLKEMPFVECARAAGGSKFYIMLKHMVPNVLPVALASMILSVPAAILTEAAISFIGLGDPSAPTWGRMLHYANSRGGFFALAWWWIIPPGLAITILTLCFVFIGHAVDEIVNPRLRRRR